MSSWAQDTYLEVVLRNTGREFGDKAKKDKQSTRVHGWAGHCCGWLELIPNRECWKIADTVHVRIIPPRGKKAGVFTYQLLSDITWAYSGGGEVISQQFCLLHWDTVGSGYLRKPPGKEIQELAVGSQSPDSGIKCGGTGPGRWYTC